ncbi:sensor histidine kinase [Sphingomonas sp. CJ99]
MRFDDTLTTVLAADWSTPSGRAAAWRQLIDLIGRRRVDVDAAVLDRLRTLRPQVPLPVRIASAGGLAYADPPAGLVALLVEDEPMVALPVLRTAHLDDAEWTELLPRLGGAGRAVLRHRRDLSAAVERALAAFGAADFVLDDQRPAENRMADADVPDLPAAEATPDADVPLEEPPVEPAMPTGEVPVLAAPDAPPAEPGPEAEAEVSPAPIAAPAATPFQSLATVAMGIPVVAEAMRRARSGGDAVPPVAEREPSPIASWFAPSAGVAPDAVPASEPAAPAPTPPADADGPFRIADVMALIDAHQRRQPAQDGEEARGPDAAAGFRFETDAHGVIRVVEGVTRAPLVGLALTQTGGAGETGFDAGVAGAWRKRSSFRNSRLFVAGSSDAGGQWRVSAMPLFDSATGRFTGYAGGARRPRADERAEPQAVVRPDADIDTLRELVHELRTPAGAITGFAELIESEMLGPVPSVYRERASAIRAQARELVGIIDDLDLSARIEAQALQLRPAEVALAPMLEGIAADLAPLAELRGTRVAIGAIDGAVDADRRGTERLLARLMATLVAHGATEEVIAVGQEQGAADCVTLSFTRPQRLTVDADALAAAEADGADDLTPLGTRFTLRLVSRLAAELGGALTIGADRLTLALPAVDGRVMERTAQH